MCYEQIDSNTSYKYYITKYDITKYDITKYDITKYYITKYYIANYYITKYYIAKYYITKFITLRIIAFQNITLQATRQLFFESIKLLVNAMSCWPVVNAMKFKMFKYLRNSFWVIKMLFIN